MRSTFVLMTVKGVPIGAHWTWLLVAALVVFSLASSLFPATYPGLSDTAYLVMAIAAGLLLFISILLHELGHAFRALAEGMRIDGITLWLFGGVARFHGMFPSPGAEFRIAVAGPLVSVLIAALFGIATLIGSRLGMPDPIQGVVDYLWRINAIVLAFNLVPALPLDGGRVFRAWLWHRQESFAAATASAARAGRAFGYMLIGIGVLDLVTGAGRGAGGLWFAFLGWFLIQAVNSEAAAGVLRQALSGRSVEDLMSSDVVATSGSVTVSEFLDDIASRPRHAVYPVVDDSRLEGVMSVALAGAVPPQERATRTVREVALPVGEVPVLTRDQDLSEALDALQPPTGRALVVDDGRLVGVLSISDVRRAAAIEQLRGRGQTTRGRRAGVVVWAVVTAVMVAAAAYLYHPPYVVFRPGHTVELTRDISISGAPRDDINGSYVLTSVRLDRPNALALAWAALAGNDVLALSEVIPEGGDREDYFERQQEVFDQSRVLAAAAAARTTGYQVAVTGTGAFVADVIPGSPASGPLRAGDVIVGLNGDPINLATELQQAVSSRPAGTRFTLTVERGAARVEVEIQSSRLSAAGQRLVGIGVVISTRDLEVDLPFDIEFQQRDIGGPSAGLAYALAIADMLDPGDHAAGRTIAATGTIDVEGSVGRIAGVDAKAAAAARAGAEIFLVPTPNADAVEQGDIDVTGVTTLEQALTALETA